MILVHLLLFIVVIVALFVQLITPLVINIPLMALALGALVFTFWRVQRGRSRGAFPLAAWLALGLQGVLFSLSLVIFFAVTLPHESAEDSPAVVQGLRRLILGESAAGTAQLPVPDKAGEAVNAPDEKKVQISVEGDEQPKTEKTEEEKKAEP